MSKPYAYIGRRKRPEAPPDNLLEGQRGVVDVGLQKGRDELGVAQVCDRVLGDGEGCGGGLSKRLVRC